MIKNYNVKIHFLNIKAAHFIVKAVNEFHAVQAALAENRIKTGCSINEMYCIDKTKVTIKEEVK